jgi:hypothetical protein
MNRILSHVVAVTLGAAIAGAVSVTMAARRQRVADATAKAMVVRLNQAEEMIAACMEQSVRKSGRLGDFPPWYGKRPADEGRLRSTDSARDQRRSPRQ